MRSRLHQLAGLDWSKIASKVASAQATTPWTLYRSRPPSPLPQTESVTANKNKKRGMGLGQLWLVGPDNSAGRTFTEEVKRRLRGRCDLLSRRPAQPSRNTPVSAWSKVKEIESKRILPANSSHTKKKKTKRSRWAENKTRDSMLFVTIMIAWFQYHFFPGFCFCYLTQYCLLSFFFIWEKKRKQKPEPDVNLIQ